MFHFITYNLLKSVKKIEILCILWENLIAVETPLWINKSWYVEFIIYFSVTNELRHVYFHRNSKCLIYLMSCKVCGKQNVRSTTERFRFWWNNYKDNQRKAKRGEDHTQKYFHEHFLNHDHNGLINEIEIILIGKTDQSDHTRREEFWWAKLKTLGYNSLNTEGWAYWLLYIELL